MKGTKKLAFTIKRKENKLKDTNADSDINEETT